MPPKKKPKFAYSHEDLLQAVQAVQNGESVNGASKKFNIPQSTLAYKVSGKTPMERRQGPTPILGFKCEGMLVKWLKACATDGFPINKENLILSASQIAKDQNIITNDLNLGKKWVSLFLKRYPEISERVPEKLSKVRSTVPEQRIRQWFKEVLDTLKEVDATEVLDDPSRIFNLDETAFFLCPKSGKVLGIRGQRNVYEVHTSSDKENLTVLCTVSATGAVAPTLIVFPGQRMPAATKLHPNVPSEWAISRSESGWINGQVFFEYIVNTFFVWLNSQKVKFPVVIFMDGHSSHLTYHLSVFCTKYKIILIALPSNCTHVMQPLDVAVFKPVKQEWSQAVHKWRTTHYDERLTKFNFSPLLKTVLDKCLKPETISNGFKRCGLYPFDENAVDYTKIDVASNTSQKNSREANVSEVGLGSEHKREDCLKFFEKFIHADLLDRFEQTYKGITPIWIGEESSQDLYVVWKKAKDSLCIGTPDKVIATNRSNISNSVTPQELPIPSTSSAVETSRVADDEPTTSNLGKDVQRKFTPVKSTREEHLAKILSPETDGDGVPTPLKKHLFWPGTPDKSSKRKNKKTEQMPAVITSKKWQEMEEKKREEKRQLEAEKAERKRLRELKKSQKSKTSKNKLTNRKIVFDKDEDWTCAVCSKRYSAELILKVHRRWIECDQCKKTYHYKCIPKKHCDAFGIEESDDDDQDEIQFLCHFCANDVDSDCEPLVISEPSDEDDEEEEVV